MIDKIPAELRQLNQWVVAGTDKIPLNPRTGQAADTTNPDTWGTFEDARRSGYLHVGFVLSPTDPYTIIDLDDPETIKVNGVTMLNPNLDEVAAIRERHSRIFETFQTYSEISQSGKGVHLICRGKVPHGRKRGKIELYSESRYMICTGNVCNPLPIADLSLSLEQLYAELSADALATTELVEAEETLTDDELWQMASTAANSEKFLRLWHGHWQGVEEWPSHSEADFALLAMLCFYSKSNAQVRRLFRYSGLNDRDKAQRDDYLDYALRKIRAKTPPPIDFSQLVTNATVFINGNNDCGSEPELVPTSEETPKRKPPPPAPRPQAIVVSDEAEEQRPILQSSIPIPPGLVGRLTEYFYASAIRPVPEIALGGALALTAGVLGRAFNISGTGLNQYILLLAKTGSGKEGIASGIDAMMSAVRPQCPLVDEFLGPSVFASGQALVRTLDKNQCFVSILGEFGITLHEMSRKQASPALASLMRVLLDLYNKSGTNRVMKPSVYSDSEKNTKTVRAPNVTIIGESNPEKFYEQLDSEIITSGLLPRFTILEYTGLRPHLNENASFPPDARLTNEFATIVNVAMASQQGNTCCPVQQDTDARRLLQEFERSTTDEINAGSMEVARQLWNRAHLKALKMSALIAVGCNPSQPIVTKPIAEWAIELVRKDAERLYKKFDTGEVGCGDIRLEHDVVRAIEDYLKMKPKRRLEYGCPEKLASYPMIPIQYLRKRCRPLVGFQQDKRGANRALSETLAAMVAGDMLAKVDPATALGQFGTRTEIFGLGNSFHTAK